MKTYLQVFSGGFKNQIINLEELMEKLSLWLKRQMLTE